MLHRSIRSARELPGHRVRILVETNIPGAAHFDGRTPFGTDVDVCSGPLTDHELCPLVSNGACPLGSFDVVVSDLDGPWAEPVRRAWEQQAVPMAQVTRTGEVDATEHVRACVGAAMAELFRATFTEPG